jgi:hypothetical protein
MKFIGILIAASALALGACAGGAPIYNVEQAPIILPPGKNASMNQVTTAIMRAGSSLGWQMQPEGPGRMSGRLNVRGLMAVIDVTHDTKSYSIKYRDSTGLHAKDGTIHKNYNGWIQNLDKRIRTELNLL